MGKAGLFILALANNGIENFKDYEIVCALENGDLEIKDKNEKRYTIDVTGIRKMIYHDEEKLEKISNVNEEETVITVIEPVVEPVVEEIPEEIPVIKKTSEDAPIIEEIHEETPELPITELKKDYPKGWHFRNKFVDVAGNVYFKGKLQEDEKGKHEISKY